ncbi:MAG: hypothetical protein ACRCUM_02465 [Mycoplasmoidaceae bacterium]
MPFGVGRKLRIDEIEKSNNGTFFYVKYWGGLELTEKVGPKLLKLNDNSVMLDLNSKVSTGLATVYQALKKE